MKKYKRIISMVAAVVLCLGATACSKDKDFDAKGYVQSAMDAIYHGEYAAYAKFLDISEEEAKKQEEEDFQEIMSQQFSEEDGMTEEGIAAYTEKMHQAYKLAKYEVLEAKKAEDGSYIVKVKAEPADVFQTLEESSTEVSNEKIAQELDPADPELFASVLMDSIQRSIDKNTYGEAVTVEVRVTKDDSGAYILDETEMNKLEDALFLE